LRKKNKYGDFLFLTAVNKNNIEIAKLIIEYANHYNIVLKLNERKII